jgi:CPA2 family monovalent cation:H+ antiporter-2
VGAFLSGNPVRTALQAGMALTQVGEFSYIIAQIGVSHGAVRGFLYDVTVAVSVVTAFTTPILIRLSGPFSRLVDSRLPRPIQTFTALYGSWLEGLRTGHQEESLWKKTRRLGLFLVLDTLCLSVIVITTSVSLKKWAPQLQETLKVPLTGGYAALVLIGLVLAVPFLIGLFRNVRAIGALIAFSAIRPAAEGKVDFGLAPRRVLTLALQMALVFALGLPFLALTQPFLPMGYSPILLVLLVAILGVLFWRSAVDLQGHVRAGAQMVAEALSSRSAPKQEEVLEEINTMAPGIGAPTSLAVGAGSPTAGKTLAELDLRSRTGASVIAITRNGERLLMPSGKEKLEAGDTVVLVGTQEAVRRARELF